MWFSAYSGFSVSKNQKWEYILKWKLECFPVFWVGMSFMCLGLGNARVLRCLSWYSQASGVPVVSRGGAHNWGRWRPCRKTSCGKSKRSGKEALDWEPHVDFSEKGRTCRRSWLWSTRDLSGQGQQRRPKSTYCWGSFWEIVKQVRLITGTDRFPLI